MTATSPYLNHPVRTEREAQLEAQVSELQKVLAPFDRMAGELFSRNWNSADRVIALYESAANPNYRNVRLSAGDFFSVRRVLHALSTTASKEGDGHP